MIQPRFRTADKEEDMREIRVFALLFAVLLACGPPAYPQDSWALEVSDPSGDSALSAYDVTYAKAWHDGTTFRVLMQLAEHYSTSTYTAYGARIVLPNGTIYGLAYMTSYPFVGPQLGISTDGGKTWGFAPGSPTGSITATEINLQIPMSNIGGRPWKVDFIAGVWWYYNSYEIFDCTSHFTIPPLLTPYHVEASQRKDGSHTVDIYYSVWRPGVSTVSVEVAVSDDGGASYDPIPVSSLSGQFGAAVRPGTRRHIEWNAGKDRPGEVGSDYKVRITASTS